MKNFAITGVAGYFLLRQFDIQLESPHKGRTEFIRSPKPNYQPRP
ncbi:MAG: hypothetical protein ABSC53_06550 [Bacteroidota bacterium]